MNRLALTMALLSLMLAACSASGAGASPSATAPVVSTPMQAATPTLEPAVLDTPTAGSPGTTPTPAENAAIQSLANTLNLPAAQISLVSAEAVIWPNGCMGVQRIGVLCAKNQVSGFIIVLQAGGKQYEFHTNQDGSLVVPAQGLQTGGPAEEAARKQLAANLGLELSGITVVSDAEVEWPDSCLGVQQAGLMCAQMVTPGHLIVLAAGGIQYEYHTNADGSEIQPASLLLVWKQDGGLAGFCNGMTIYLSGEVHASSCLNVKDTTLGQLLSSADQAQLKQWQAQFGRVNVDLSDPKNAADAMTRTLYFNGSGSGQPDGDQQHALYSWAQALFQKIKIGE